MSGLPGTQKRRLGRSTADATQPHTIDRASCDSDHRCGSYDASESRRRPGSGSTGNSSNPGRSVVTTSSAHDERTLSVTAHSRLRPSAVAVAGVAAAGLVLSACGSSDSTGSATGTSSKSGGSADLSQVKSAVSTYSAARSTYGTYDKVTTPPNLAGKTVWYIPTGNSIPIFKAKGQNFSQALSHTGADVHVCDGKFQPTTVASCLQSAATQGAAAVVLGAVDYSTVATAVQSVVSKGIPVLISDEPVPDGVQVGKNLQFLPITAPTALETRLTADLAIEDSGGKAHAIVVRLDDSATTKAGGDAAVAEFKQKCSACTTTVVDATGADIAKLGSALSAALVSHPDTNYIVGLQDSFLSAALPGIQSAGYANKVKLIPIGGDLAALQQIKSGQVFADVGQGPSYGGWAIADALIRQLAGEKITPLTDQGVRVFTSSNVGGLDLTNAGYVSTSWYGGDQWQKDMLASWGVK